MTSSVKNSTRWASRTATWVALLQLSACADGGDGSHGPPTPHRIGDGGTDAEPELEGLCEELKRELSPRPEPAGPEDYLGRGLSEATQELHEQCVSGDALEFSPQSGSALLSIGLSSEQKLRSALGLARNDSFTSLAIDDRRRVLNGVHFPPKSQVWVAHGRYEAGTVQYTGEPASAYTELARNAAPELFPSLCGDRYIQNVVMGGDLFIVHVVDLTSAPAEALLELSFDFAEVYYRGEPDRVHPHRRYIFHLGGGQWAVDPNQFEGPKAQLLFRCFGVLAKDNPAPLRALTGTYDGFDTR